MIRGSFFKTLHLRMSVLFLALLAVVFVGYYQWVNRTIYEVEWAPGEEQWHNELQEAESDSLAALLTATLDDSTARHLVLADYGRHIAAFDAELALVDGSGWILATTRPDSLSRILRFVSPVLLDSMSLDDWDYSSYPDSYDMDAYVNRITGVLPIRVDGDSTAPADAWLLSSFKPLAVSTTDLDYEDRIRRIRGAGAMLLYAFLTGLVIMAWVSRRIRALSADMAKYREGDYEHRASEGDRDEIATLGRDFNRLADSLTDVIGKLKQSEEYRKQLVANISHDLRTPMASLRGHVETLTLHDQDLSPEVRERALSTIAANTDNLEALIERLFELTQLESGRMEYRREAFSLEELSHEVLARCEGPAAEKGVALHCDVAGELPLVDADPLRIGQVLQNLVGNAVKFNRVDGEVHLILTAKADGVAVEVRDTGIGIASEDLPHVFERFYTAEKSRTAKGAGLGLAIAHRIVTGHGSELTIESDKDVGTAFRFTLPAANLD
ncbi:HAMP domain-containing histidine kinase [bacterium]|nr:HAMP domain-containing histidine kinase [bacterium]MBU1072940.1 HAMP domain-containing histidine kinase [bacterium]MBU1676694.1 HAMP domain-containing histidine kinase [bacterium]